MLMLQYQNLLLQSVLSERLDPETPPLGIDQVVSDFDNVTFHISNPDPKDKTVIMVSMYIKCFQDLVKCGAKKILEREYGPYLTEPEPGYDVSLLLNLTDGSIPSDPEQRDELVNKIALLKRNTFAAPFEKAFDKFDQLAEEAAAEGKDLYAPKSPITRSWRSTTETRSPSTCDRATTESPSSSPPSSRTRLTESLERCSCRNSLTLDEEPSKTPPGAVHAKGAAAGDQRRCQALF